ncbi:MAG: hypothetical protein KJN84_02945 [Bacteroidia bacterium]|nr:hypothetical protein [Bacteroidia bacterium]
MNACKQKSIETVSTQEVSNYITSHTSSQIEPSDEVFFRLSNLKYDQYKIGTELQSDAVSISPKVKGKFIWKDNQKVVLVPDEPLSFDQLYEVKIDLGSFFKDTQLKDYTFKFNTDRLIFDPYNFKLNQLSSQDSDELEFSADIYSNLNLTQENIHKYIDVEVEGKNQEIKNLVLRSPSIFHFTVGPLLKNDKEQVIVVKHDFKERNSESKGERSTKIPSKKDFVVISSEIIDNQKGHIQVVFSNGLKKQQFDGLIKIDNYSGQYKFTAKNNQLDIYVDNTIQGKHTLTFNSAILDKNNNPLKAQQEFNLVFKQTMPQIKAVSSGTIVPFEKEVIFPFEAISLDTVEIEIFKIFENNILDFLRYSKLSDASSDGFIGRVIHNQKIALKNISKKSNKNTWVRYALDLHRLTTLEPGAVYQVRIGFKKSYANFDCKGKDVSEINDTKQSTFSHFRYYNGYSYEHNDDPCYPAYYRRNRFIYRNLLASNLGLIVKEAKNDHIKVFATDLKSGSTVQGVTIKLFDKQQQLIAEKKTDGQGMVDFIDKPSGLYVVAKNAKNYAYVALKNNLSNSMSPFEISGTSHQNGIAGYLYGERGVWRPGDTLHLSYMLYDKKNTIASSHPVNLVVSDSKGKTKFNFSETENSDGLYVFHVPTNTSDPTGQWSATARIGNHTTSKRLKVETIKPNRIKVDMEFPNDEIDVSNNEAFKLVASWLHGAPASDLRTEVDVKYLNVSAHFKAFDKYRFSDPARKIESTLSNVYAGNVNIEGEKDLTLKFGSGFRPPSKLKAKLRTRVFEKSGNYSEDFTQININPYSAYVGVKVPESRWGSKILNPQKNESIDFVVVDKDGNPLKDRELTVGVYNAQWRWWYNSNDNNIFKYNSSNHYEAIDKRNVKTNEEGSGNFIPKLNGHGRYLIRICDTESGHCTGELFYTSRYRSSNKEDGEIATLNFKTDKNTYAPKEDINLEIPSSPNSNILVSIENNQEIVDAFWVESTGDLTKVNFRANERMIPNAYVHVTLIQGTNNNENDLPIRLYGVQNIKIDDPKTQLVPEINCAEEFQPNSNVEISVEEKTGKEMSYTVAVVDEGLLDITNFKTPNPKSHFFAKQSLGVKSWDLYDYVLNNHGGEIEKIFTVGGDGSNAQDSENPSANRFRPVVRFLGPFKLKKGESKSHNVDIPNYVGAVRLMVVAKNRVAFGQTEKNVPVKKPLMLMSTLPRVLAPGETIDVPVNVFAYDDNIKEVTVNAETDNLILPLALEKNQLAFERQGDQMTNFKYKVGELTGISKFKFDATANNFEAKDEVEIEIRNPSPIKTIVESELVQPGEKWSAAFGNVGISGSNEAVLEISQFPAFDLKKRLAYLIKYPYGCVEQTTSSVFPQLYLSQVSNQTEEEKNKIRINVEAGIRRLVGFQTTSGGLSYWPGSADANSWGTSYAGHFLLEAIKKGYYVNDQFIKNWTAFQKRQSQKFKYSSRYYNQIDQAYRLFTLVLAGSPDLSAMNYLRSQPKLNNTVACLLSASYALVGQKNVAKNLIENLDFTVDEFNELGYSYGSKLRDRSLMLMCLQYIGDEKEAFKLGISIAEKLSSTKWYNTQALAFGLMSLTQYIGGLEKGDIIYNFKFDADMNVKHTSGEALDIYSLNVNDSDSHNFSFENNSNNPLYVRILNSGKPLPSPSPSYAKGLKMDVKYTDDVGKPIDPILLKQGKDFKIQIKVKNVSSTGQRYDELALNHTLPSGWEIQNMRLGDMGSQNNQKFDFQDIRDDRVYTFFDLNGGESITISVDISATYTGEFFMPNIVCEAMYDKEISVSHEGNWVQITK